jgi:hypothetical protein
MSENPHSPEDWRQVRKGQRAVTHTDEHRANHTPVRNQFQELSEHQEDPTPRLAPREQIVAFSRLPPDDHNTDIPEDDNTDIPEDDNTDIPENDHTDTGSIGSTESFDTMTDTTSDYASLLETIRLVSAEQATVFSRKKKNYAEIVKFREFLGSALATLPCSTHDSGYSWLVNTEEDFTHRTGTTTAYTVQSMPKRPSRPPEPQNSASSEEYKRYAIDLQKYNNYLHWNKEALAALEHRFPQSLTPKRNKFEVINLKLILLHC